MSSEPPGDAVKQVSGYACRPVPEKPLDLLAEIERELPLVSFRHYERHNQLVSSPEKFRDTDSIRFLKQNRLSWWSSPASAADMDEMEPVQNIYEVVEEDPKVDKPHEYEDIPDDFFLHRRQNQLKTASVPIPNVSPTNPFLNSDYDVPISPDIDLFIAKPDTPQPSSLYDLPRSPSSSGFGDPLSAYQTSVSTSLSETFDASLSGEQTYDVPQSPAADQSSFVENYRHQSTSGYYDIPAEHFATTPRNKTSEESKQASDVFRTFPRTRRDAYEGLVENDHVGGERLSSFSHIPSLGMVETYDIPNRPESERSDFMSSMLSDTAYDIPSSLNPPSSPPPPPPPESPVSKSPPPIPERPQTPIYRTLVKETVATRPPPVPAPRQKNPPPLPPKQENTPQRSRLSDSRKYSLQPTMTESPIKESFLRKWESGTSLTSWYLDANQIKNCDIPHKELVSSEEGEPSSLPPIPGDFHLFATVISTKTPLKNKESSSSPQRSSSKRIATAFKTVSRSLMRKPASLPTNTSSESWDSNSADSDTVDGITVYFNGDGRKDFIQRLCVVTDATIKFYDLDSLSTPSLCLCCDEISLMLARRDICPQTKSTPNLFLVDLRTGNVSRSLGFKSAIERADFLRKVHHSSTPESVNLPGEIWASGLLRYRSSASGDWQKIKAVLHGKEFTPFLIGVEKEPPVASIDLRKTKVIDWTNATEQQEDRMFHMVLPCRTVYLKGPSNIETNAWFDLLVKTHSTYLDKSLLGEQYLNNENVPIAIEKCVNFVSAHGTDTTGVYRLAGSHSKIERLVDALKRNAWDVHLIPEEYTAHDVANALKRFLRSFDDCLITRRLYEQWIECSKIVELSERLPRLKDLISELPVEEHATLRFLCSHLKAIADRSDINCMTVNNLGAIFGPTILYKESIQSYLDRDPSLTPTNSMAETNAGMAIAGDLLANFCFLFDVSQEVVDKERQIQKLIAELKEARVAQRPAGDILVGVYVYNKEWGRCVNVKITPTMTAMQLCKHIRSKLSLADPVNSLGVFEVICEQQLERPLHFTESVFTAVLQWTGWDPAFAKDNFLLVKRNFVYEDVVNFLNMKQPLSNYSEVKFADASSKNFKKVSIEFAKSAVQIVKEKKDKEKDRVILREWRVEDICVYIGTESGRKVQSSKFCLSFVTRDENVRKSKERPYLCHSISLASQISHTSWLASVLCARHSHLIPPEEEAPDLLSL